MKKPYKKTLNGREVLFLPPGSYLSEKINQRIEDLFLKLEKGEYTQKDYTDFCLLQDLVKSV